jgi:hypothetical protein
LKGRGRDSDRKYQKEGSRFSKEGENRFGDKGKERNFGYESRQRGRSPERNERDIRKAGDSKRD